MNETTLRQLPPYPFPGPDPDMTGPDSQAVCNAEISLRIAMHSTKHGEPKGISEDNAHILLKEMIYLHRMGLTELLFQGSKEIFEKAVSDLYPHCDISMQLPHHTAIQIGLKESLWTQLADDNVMGFSTHELREIIAQGDIHRVRVKAHGFSVVKLPIQIEDKVVWKRYLLDTTYRQFFLEGGGSFSVPGKRITGSLRGREIADKILREGYIELTEETANHYVGSFFGFNDMRSQPEKISYLSLLVPETAHYIDGNPDPEIRRMADKHAPPLHRLLTQYDKKPGRGLQKG